MSRILRGSAYRGVPHWWTDLVSANTRTSELRHGVRSKPKTSGVAVIEMALSYSTVRTESRSRKLHRPSSLLTIMLAAASERGRRRQRTSSVQSKQRSRAVGGLIRFGLCNRQTPSNLATQELISPAILDSIGRSALSQTVKSLHVDLSARNGAGQR